MTSETSLQNDTAPLVACTISRDIQNFDLLIEDMETELGEAWGDLNFDEAKLFLEQPESADLKFVAVAMNKGDEEDFATIAGLVASAKSRGIKVILIPDDVSPLSLHKLLQAGAEDFIPYPLPENSLAEAIARLERPAQTAEIHYMEPVDGRHFSAARANANGTVIAVQSIAGGAGATTVAVNLAWELANIEKKGNTQPRVLVIDLNLQYGSVSTYLDLPRREAVFELLTSTDLMDTEAFKQALQSYDDKFKVLTAPPELLPLDILDSEDVQRILDMATSLFDYVIIDMPTTIVQWTETVLNASEIYFAPFDIDLRSAQNILRLRSALRTEDLPFEKIRFLLNRAPKGMDISARARAKKMAENLEINVDVQLPEGGKPVREACDQGLPLGEAAPKNALRKELNKLAASIHLRQSAMQEAAE